MIYLSRQARGKRWGFTIWEVIAAFILFLATQFAQWYWNYGGGGGGGGNSYLCQPGFVDLGGAPAGCACCGQPGGSTCFVECP